MKTKASLHTYVARKLKLSDYYGNNLDALHDCLSERATPLHITVTYTARLKENLGRICRRIFTGANGCGGGEYISYTLYP